MVVKQVKHWLVTRANAARWRAIQEWADSRQADFTQTRDAQGFQIEQPKARPGALRIEWGASQRDYIVGAELRMRCEMQLHPDLQLMVVCRDLMDQLERTVFEAYTDTLKTRVDTDTPEEMRWLVMFAKHSPHGVPGLRERFGFVGVHKDLVAAWVEAELGHALAQASAELLPAGHPFVLMCMRGNLYLRTAMPEPDLPKIQALLRLLECAGKEALRINGRLAEVSPWPTTMAASWQPSGRPDELPPR